MRLSGRYAVLIVCAVAGPAFYPGLANGQEPAGVCAVKGAFYEYYRSDDAAKLAGFSVNSLFLHEVNDVTSLLPAFPPEAESVAKYRLVILLNVDAEALGFWGRQALEKAVREDGTGLLVCGEFSAFGGGRYADTFLERMLPVRLSGAYDLERASPPLSLTVSSPKGSYRELAWEEKPSVRWYHRLSPCAEAQVPVTMGREPFLVIRRYGAGTVGILAGTVLGSEDGSFLPFWRWKDWPRFMAETMKLLMREK